MQLRTSSKSDLRSFRVIKFKGSMHLWLTKVFRMANTRNYEVYFLFPNLVSIIFLIPKIVFNKF